MTLNIVSQRSRNRLLNPVRSPPGDHTDRSNAGQPEASMKTKVLFVCTENSARSQMAEGFLRHRGGDDFEALSAGAEPTRVNPMAVDVMKEVGIDISGQHAKDVSDFLGQNFQYLIRVCYKVREKCPRSPRGSVVPGLEFRRSRDGDRLSCRAPRGLPSGSG